MPLPSHLNFCSEFWRMFAIFVIYAKFVILSRSPLLKGHFAISFQLFLRLWRTFAIFVIYVKFAIFVKIVTLQGPLCHLISIFPYTLVNFRYFQYFRQNRYVQRGPLCYLIRVVAKALTNSHHICHFCKNHHFQRAPLPSYLNFS